MSFACVRWDRKRKRCKFFLQWQNDFCTNLSFHFVCCQCVVVLLLMLSLLLVAYSAHAEGKTESQRCLWATKRKTSSMFWFENDCRGEKEMKKVENRENRWLKNKLFFSLNRFFHVFFLFISAFSFVLFCCVYILFFLSLLSHSQCRRFMASNLFDHFESSNTRRGIKACILSQNPFAVFIHVRWLRLPLAPTAQNTLFLFCRKSVFVFSKTSHNANRKLVCATCKIEFHSCESHCEFVVKVTTTRSEKYTQNEYFLSFTME